MNIRVIQIELAAYLEHNYLLPADPDARSVMVVVSKHGKPKIKNLEYVTLAQVEQLSLRGRNQYLAIHPEAQLTLLKESLKAYSGLQESISTHLRGLAAQISDANDVQVLRSAAHLRAVIDHD